MYKENMEKADRILSEMETYKFFHIFTENEKIGGRSYAKRK
jgi:hypothetical protein